MNTMPKDPENMTREEYQAWNADETEHTIYANGKRVGRMYLSHKFDLPAGEYIDEATTPHVAKLRWFIFFAPKVKTLVKHATTREEAEAIVRGKFLKRDVVEFKAVKP